MRLKPSAFADDAARGAQGPGLLFGVQRMQFQAKASDADHLIDFEFAGHVNKTSVRRVAGKQRTMDFNSQFAIGSLSGNRAIQHSGTESHILHISRINLQVSSNAAHHNYLLGGCLVGVIAGILFLVFGYRKLRRWIMFSWIRHRTDPFARSALLLHREHTNKPSFEIFLDFVKTPDGPPKRLWHHLMTDDTVSKRIDIAFDSAQGQNPFRKEDMLRWAERLIFKMYIRWNPEEPLRERRWDQIREGDLWWLLKSWDEIFPGGVDRIMFHDLFKLVLTWHRAIETQFITLSREWVVAFPEVQKTVHVALDNHPEPLQILFFSVSQCQSAPGRTVAWKHEISVRSISGLPDSTEDIAVRPMRPTPQFPSPSDLDEEEEEEDENPRT